MEWYSSIMAERKSRREINAEATQRAIVESAARLFVEQGYAPTTVGQIARESGVAVQTIYNAVGSKRDLLIRVLDFAAAGDRAPRTVPSFMQEQAEAEPDPRKVIALLVDFWRGGLQRTAPIFEVIRQAAALDPDIAVISAMDPDHLDIYGTAQAMEEAFIDFSKKVKPGGLLISKFGLKRGKELKAPRHLTYSLQNESADAYAENIRMNNGSYEFDVVVKDSKLKDVILNMGGMHNVENAVAAIAVASSLEIENDKIRGAVESFKGVKRRFEYIIKNERIVFIDDYAHHPAELGALIRGAKSLFSFKKCTVIFQPHLFSRTKDFSKEFAESLDMADRILLLPIYPARELPVEGVTSDLILKEMENKNATVISKEELLKYIGNDYLKSVHESNYGEVLITAGAGDIDKLVQPIKEILLNTF